MFCVRECITLIMQNCASRDGRTRLTPGFVARGLCDRLHQQIGSWGGEGGGVRKEPSADVTLQGRGPDVVQTLFRIFAPAGPIHYPEGLPGTGRAAP